MRSSRSTIIEPRVLIEVAAVVAWMCTAASAQPDYMDLAAYVTMVGGRGEVVRVDAEETSRIPELFSFDENRIGPGQALRTSPDSTAVLTMPAYDAVIYLEGSSELRVEEPAVPDAGVELLLTLASGRASVVRRSESERWMLVAGEADAPGEAGYVLSQRASLYVEADPRGVTFAVRSGDAIVFAGAVPAAVLIDDSGMPVDRTGVTLPEGQRVSMRGVLQPVADEQADVVVPAGLREQVSSFALTASYRWLHEAEKGDFIPVRGAARAAPGVLGGEFEPALAFDQPRPVAATSAPRAITTPVRSSLSPAQTLVESGVPGTVIAGQRFRRSRIIGNPATSASGTGALTVNRAAELLVRLGPG